MQSFDGITASSTPSEARARTNASSSAATAEAPHDGDDAFAAAPVVSDGDDDDDNVGAGNSSGTSAGYYQRRGERCPVRTAIAAVVLFTIGTVFTIWGLMTLRQERDRGIAMLVLGGMTFLPGSYASFQLYGAWKRWPGYKYAYVPSYDD